MPGIKHSHILGAALLGTLCLMATRSEAQVLTIAYNERPPYHYAEKGSPVPKGLVADIVVRAVRDSGIPATYVSMGTQRIMMEMKAGERLCSFGWFRNEERLKTAKFTHGLWQDEPFVVVVGKESEKVFRSHPTLAAVFHDESLHFGTRWGTSYGTYIDNLRKSARAGIVEPVNTQANMVRMLAAKRFDFLILLPTEMEDLFREAQVNRNDYTVIKYPDIPKGDKRRIMCSKAVPDETIRRLNNSIAKFVPSATLE